MRRPIRVKSFGLIGQKHVGEFRDGESHGQGTEYAANGRVLKSGSWSNGAFVGSVAASSSGHWEVALVKEGGTFKVPVVIDSTLVLNFVVDSGATDVTIPADVVMTLLRTGTLGSDDFTGTQRYQLADGSTVPSQTFTLRSLKVGDKVIQNVRGSMTTVEGSLLLGQSFLSRFGRVSFDYSRQVLVLE